MKEKKKVEKKEEVSSSLLMRGRARSLMLCFRLLLSPLTRLLLRMRLLLPPSPLSPLLRRPPLPNLQRRRKSPINNWVLYVCSCRLSAVSPLLLKLPPLRLPPSRL